MQSLPSIRPAPTPRTAKRSAACKRWRCAGQGSMATRGFRAPMPRRNPTKISPRRGEGPSRALHPGLAYDQPRQGRQMDFVPAETGKWSSSAEPLALTSPGPNLLPHRPNLVGETAEAGPFINCRRSAWGGRVQPVRTFAGPSGRSGLGCPLAIGGRARYKRETNVGATLLADSRNRYLGRVATGWPSGSLPGPADRFSAPSSRMRTWTIAMTRVPNASPYHADSSR
jgi:hypothetical protein